MSRSTRGKAPAKIVQAARTFRGEPTPAEDRLWEALRGRKLAGLKFRRQHPYERFVLDFFCVERHLVVEVDGGVHLDPEQAERDGARTEFLQKRKIRVLRFRNDEVEQNLQGVLQRIVEATLPHPRAQEAPPSPETEKRVSEEGES